MAVSEAHKEFGKYREHFSKLAQLLAPGRKVTGIKMDLSVSHMPGGNR